MRPVNQRGLTIVELMVAFAIASMLALAAAPYFSDYGLNSRLRESGNTLYAEALFAQSEAIKRNREVQVSTAGNTVTVIEVTSASTTTTLRTRDMATGVTLPTATVGFNSTGWTADLEAHSIDLSHSSTVCDSDHRCPGVRIEAGGSIRLCGNKTIC